MIARSRIGRAALVLFTVLSEQTVMDEHVLMSAWNEPLGRARIPLSTELL
jgi:hypothetical protein